jgi:hypothetical protein
VKKETDWPKVIDQACKHYTKVPHDLPSQWDEAKPVILRKLNDMFDNPAKYKLKLKASPGIPWSALGCTLNKHLLEGHRPIVTSVILARLELLYKLPYEEVSTMSAKDLVLRGLCDAIRMFIKNEPYNTTKASMRRWRLIWSLSFVDQMVERILHDSLNKHEIEHTMGNDLPSMPGQNLNLSAHYQMYRKLNLAAEDATGSDVSAWDINVTWEELLAEAWCRINLTGATGQLRNAILNHAYVSALSLIVFSDGTVYAQDEPGIMKSGRYCTSSSNSRIRFVAALRIGAAWARTMGDDAIESWVDNATEKYLEIGKICKIYQKRENLEEPLEFCSNLWFPHIHYPAAPSRMLYRFLNVPKGEQTPERYSQFLFEVQASPDLPQLLEIISRSGWGSENFDEEILIPHMGKRNKKKQQRGGQMAMPTVRQQARRSNVQYGPTRGPHTHNAYIKQMGDRHGMKTAAGMGFCEQVFSPERVGETVYLPPSMQCVIDNNSVYNGPPNAGTVMAYHKQVSVQAGTTLLGLTINLDLGGYSDSGDMLVTDSAYAGSALPTVVTTGVTSGTSTSLCPWALPAGRGDTMCVVLGQRVRVTLNDQAATSRKGKVLAGWLPSITGSTWEQIASRPGQKAYDGAILTEQDRFEVLAPPEAYNINNRVTSDSVTFAASISGCLYVLGKGFTTGDTLTVEIDTLVYYYGMLVGAQTNPVFSQAGYDCALTCWGEVMGRDASLVTSKRGGKISQVHKSMEKHSAHNTPSKLLSTIWEGTKKVGSWALGKALQYLPALLL